MKTIGFFIRHFTERGTEVAVYDYADHNETILGNKSIIYCFTPQKQQQVRFPPSKACYQKFQNRFEIKEINDFIFVLDASQSIKQIEAMVKRHIAKRKLDLLVVDYIQIVKREYSKNINEATAIKEITTGLKDIAKKYKIQIIGPNCLGVMNLDPKTMMNSTFLKVTQKSGKIALISQSGAICAALVEDASAQGIGFSAVISLGGGAPISQQAQAALLSSDSMIVFLDVSLSTAAPRVGFNRDRPLLLGNPRAQWQALSDQRRPIYEKLATQSIKVDDMTVDEIIAIIESILS